MASEPMVPRLQEVIQVLIKKIKKIEGKRHQGCWGRQCTIITNGHEHQTNWWSFVVIIRDNKTRRKLLWKRQVLIKGSERGHQTYWWEKTQKRTIVRSLFWCLAHDNKEGRRGLLLYNATRRRRTSRRNFVYKITRYTQKEKGVACGYDRVYRDNKTIKDCLERRLEQYGTTRTKQADHLIL